MPCAHVGDGSHPVPMSITEVARMIATRADMGVGPYGYPGGRGDPPLQEQASRRCSSCSGLLPLVLEIPIREGIAPHRIVDQVRAGGRAMPGQRILDGRCSRAH